MSIMKKYKSKEKKHQQNVIALLASLPSGLNELSCLAISPIEKEAVYSSNSVNLFPVSSIATSPVVTTDVTTTQPASTEGANFVSKPAAVTVVSYKSRVKIPVQRQLISGLTLAVSQNI